MTIPNNQARTTIWSRKILAPVVLGISLLTFAIGAPLAYAHGGGGDEGCTPGYWKNHQAAAEAIVIPGFGGATAGQVTVNQFFGTSLSSEFGDLTLAQAAALKGDTALKQLIRQAVSALLNSLTIDSFYSDVQVRAMFRDAIDPNYQQLLGIVDDDDLEDIKDLFDDANNLGCPLN